MILLIRFYQFLKPAILSINMAVFGVAPTCKQSPSCSEYTILQIKKRGTISGLLAGFRRVSTCH